MPKLEWHGDGCIDVCSTPWMRRLGTPPVRIVWKQRFEHVPRGPQLVSCTQTPSDVHSLSSEATHVRQPRWLEANRRLLAANAWPLQSRSRPCQAEPESSPPEPRQTLIWTVGRGVYPAAVHTLFPQMHRRRRATSPTLANGHAQRPHWPHPQQPSWPLKISHVRLAAARSLS